MIDKRIRCNEYAPDVFAHLRELDGYTIEDLKRSLDPCLNKNIENIFKAGEGMGKSGSFFFFSHDDRFIIKTMTSDDFHAFMSLFVAYFYHINRDNSSLLARVYGVYQITLENMKPTYLMLMGNTKNVPSENIYKMFDLKGSIIKRLVLPDKHKNKNTYALKDQNLLDL